MIQDGIMKMNGAPSPPSKYWSSKEEDRIDIMTWYMPDKSSKTKEELKIMYKNTIKKLQDEKLSEAQANNVFKPEWAWNYEVEFDKDAKGTVRGYY